MAKLSFRKLRADEVEARVGTVSEKGVSILLYKDARCDMIILDETVGPLNWQRTHSRDNANCIVSIYDEDKKEWVSKEDTGTESFTEKQKGLASDSFKRACVNWGIGRELYTVPFIWFGAKTGEVNIIERNGKKTTNDKFIVEEMEVDDAKRITKVVVVNTSTKVRKTFMPSGRSSTTGTVSPTTAPSKPKSISSAPDPAKADASKNPENVGDYKITIDCVRKGKTLNEVLAADGGANFLKQVVRYAPSKPDMQVDAPYVTQFLKEKGLLTA